MSAVRDSRHCLSMRLPGIRCSASRARVVTGAPAVSTVAGDIVPRPGAEWHKSGQHAPVVDGRAEPRQPRGGPIRRCYAGATHILGE